MVRRWNDGSSTSSVDPHLDFSSAFIFASFPIQSTNQHHNPSMDLQAIDASPRSTLRFSSTRGTETYLLSDRCFSRTVHRYDDPSVVPHLVRFPWAFSRWLDLHLKITTCGPSMGRRIIDGFMGHFCTDFCTTICIFFLKNFPAKHR